MTPDWNIELRRADVTSRKQLSHFRSRQGFLEIELCIERDTSNIINFFIPILPRLQKHDVYQGGFHFVIDFTVYLTQQFVVQRFYSFFISHFITAISELFSLRI